MHSLIAALSSGVPALSIAYSLKSRGLNREMFGHEDYCLDFRKMTPQAVAGGIASLLADAESVRSTLAERLPGIREQAYEAGRILRVLIE